MRIKYNVNSIKNPSWPEHEIKYPHKCESECDKIGRGQEEIIYWVHSSDIDRWEEMEDKEAI